MSTQEEGIHQVPGKSSCCARKSEQGTHRRIKVPQRAVLSAEERLSRANIIKLQKTISRI